jgi:hypothetical protein
VRCIAGFAGRRPNPKKNKKTPKKTGYFIIMVWHGGDRENPKKTPKKSYFIIVRCGMEAIARIPKKGMLFYFRGAAWRRSRESQQNKKTPKKTCYFISVRCGMEAIA